MGEAVARQAYVSKLYNADCARFNFLLRVISIVSGKNAAGSAGGAYRIHALVLLFRYSPGVMPAPARKLRKNWTRLS